MKMLELSFLSAGVFDVPFLLPCSGLPVSDFVLVVRPSVGLLSAGAGVLAISFAPAGGGAAAAFTTAGGGGRVPSLRCMIVRI